MEAPSITTQKGTFIKLIGPLVAVRTSSLLRFFCCSFSPPVTRDRRKEGLNTRGQMITIPFHKPLLKKKNLTGSPLESFRCWYFSSTSEDEIFSYSGNAASARGTPANRQSTMTPT